MKIEVKFIFNRFKHSTPNFFKMSYPVFVGNEQNDEELYYDVPTDFFETMQKFMACNSGLTTKEYVTSLIWIIAVIG